MHLAHTYSNSGPPNRPAYAGGGSATGERAQPSTAAGAGNMGAERLEGLHAHAEVAAGHSTLYMRSESETSAQHGSLLLVGSHVPRIAGVAEQPFPPFSHRNSSSNVYSTLRQAAKVVASQKTTPFVLQSCFSHFPVRLHRGRTQQA